MFFLPSNTILFFMAQGRRHPEAFRAGNCLYHLVYILLHFNYFETVLSSRKKQTGVWPGFPWKFLVCGFFSAVTAVLAAFCRKECGIHGFDLVLLDCRQYDQKTV